MGDNSELLKVKDLKVRFFTYKSVVRAVRGIGFNIGKGETVGLVGESGCGKSVTALSIMRLVPSPPGEIESGEIWFEGDNLLEKSEEEMRMIRGKNISMIFQDPVTALNPVFTVGDQIQTVIRLHQHADKSQAIERAVGMMSKVGLPDPSRILKKYPHELSGGMNQRIMIAMALSCQPSLLIADEPTTALDVTIQAQIMQLMRELKKEMNTAILLITHDLGVVAEMCEQVAVMHAGCIVEKGSLRQVFKSPQHPYTQGLFASTPKIEESRERLEIIKGSVPDLSNPPPGCSFVERCPSAERVCWEEMPNGVEVKEGHWVYCFQFQADRVRRN